MLRQARQCSLGTIKLLIIDCVCSSMSSFLCPLLNVVLHGELADMCQYTDFLYAVCASYVKEIYVAFALDTRTIEGQTYQGSPSKLNQRIILKYK